MSDSLDPRNHCFTFSNPIFNGFSPVEHQYHPGHSNTQGAILVDCRSNLLPVVDTGSGVTVNRITFGSAIRARAGLWKAGKRQKLRPEKPIH
jgi:hypothetical protein